MLCTWRSWPVTCAGITIFAGALSFFIDDPVVARYFADWRQLVPPQWADRRGNHLRENHGGGVHHA